MLIELVDDPAVFARRAQRFLASEPFTANVISVVAARAIAGDERSTPGDTWILLTDDDGTVVGAGMANSPYNLFLPRLPEGAAALIADRLHAEGRALPGVTGEAATAQAFADRWQALHGVDSALQIAHRTYRLRELLPPVGVDGAARRAREDEVAIVAQHLDAFHDEALPHDPRVDATELAGQRIAAGEIWLWTVDEEVGALAAHGRPAAGVSRIGPVYTLPTHRRRGFGAGATAAAVDGALDAGARYVMLYADRANSTSNALYQRLGFVPDHDAIDLGFRKPD